MSTATFEIIERKSKVSPDQADNIAQIVLTALDAAKKGLAPNSMGNTLYEHVLTAGLLWKLTGNMALMNRTQEAIDALGKAFRRPGEMITLTTSEYTALREALGYYLRNMKRIEVGRLADANKAARRHMAES